MAHHHIGVFSIPYYFPSFYHFRFSFFVFLFSFSIPFLLDWAYKTAKIKENVENKIKINKNRENVLNGGVGGGQREEDMSARPSS